MKFIEMNPMDKVVLSGGDSAVACALKCGFLDIYELLVENGFKLAVEEDMKKILDFLEENPKTKRAKKTKLKAIHRKHMKESSKKFLLKLIMMSKLAPTTPGDKQNEFEEIIAETFGKLSGIPKVEKIIMWTTFSRRIGIVKK
jgi:hypothetical protein